MIRFSHVTKRYKTHSGINALNTLKALDDVSCKIGKGEFVLITGASGAGKSTFIKLIFQELKADNGEVVAFGKKLSAMKPAVLPLYRRNIGYIFQDFRLIKSRTVQENISLAMEVLGKRQAEVKENTAKMLSMLRLDAKRFRYPMELSGGEQQRVSIGRALINNPSILLADEPTGNLDISMAMEIISLIKTINEMGTTVIVASHNPAIFQEVKGYHITGHRHISLRDGRIVSDQLISLVSGKK